MLLTISYKDGHTERIEAQRIYAIHTGGASVTLSSDKVECIYGANAPAQPIRRCENCKWYNQPLGEGYGKCNCRHDYITPPENACDSWDCTERSNNV